MVFTPTCSSSQTAAALLTLQRIGLNPHRLSLPMVHTQCPRKDKPPPPPHSHLPRAGKEYAINQLTCFLAILSMATDWSRRRTEKSSEWVYLPTIYPADALITFSPRA